MSDEMKIPPTPRAFWVEKINRAIEMMPELGRKSLRGKRAEKGETKMETQFLARWHAGCANIKDGPFRYVSVAVSKLTQTATVTFIREPGRVETAFVSKIGADEREYTQIGNEILAVVLQHGLLDNRSEKSVFDGDAASGSK